MLQLVLLDIKFALLVDGSIHEECTNRRCRTVDSHTDRCARIAKIESAVEFFCIVKTADADTTIAYFAIDIWSVIWVFAVQSHGVECSAETIGRHIDRHVVKSLVGSLWTSFTSKHPRRIFFFAFEWIDTCCIRKFSWHILLQTPSHYFAKILVAR